MSAGDYEALDVTSWDVVSDETAGADEKLWLMEPDSQAKWLFKPVTIKAGHRHGEDWAEKAASELAHTLMVPSARVELAHYGEWQGTISRNLCPEPYDLQPGYIVMLAHPIEGFQPGNVRGRPGHSLRNIQIAMGGALAPPGCNLPANMDAFGAFAGYVMLDALTANQDRHDENWSLLLPRLGNAPRRLCGSYDHANSLGYNLRDGERARRLETAGEVEAWAERGRAVRLEHDPEMKPMTLVSAAAQCFELTGGEVKDFWLEHLAGLEENLAEQILTRFPEMSEPSRRFATILLKTNRRRILDECN